MQYIATLSNFNQEYFKFLILSKTMSWLDMEKLFLHFSTEIFFLYLGKKFQHTLLVDIIKSTLLLRIECQDIHIFMKKECLQTSTALFREGRNGKSLEGKDEKSLRSLKV